MYSKLRPLRSNAPTRALGLPDVDAACSEPNPSLAQRGTARCNLLGSLGTLAAIGCLALLAAPAGCATSNSGSETGRRAKPSEGTSLQARGDWNDVEAAAVQGCNDAEAVVHDTLKVHQHKIEYAIRTVDDQTGVLTFTRLDSRAGSEGSEGGAQGEGAEISVFCRVGDFGDAERERRVVREVADRLRQLQGVDFAPAR